MPVTVRSLVARIACAAGSAGLLGMRCRRTVGMLPPAAGSCGLPVAGGPVFELVRGGGPGRLLAGRSLSWWPVAVDDLPVTGWVVYTHAGLADGARCRHRVLHGPAAPAARARSRPSADGNGCARWRSRMHARKGAVQSLATGPEVAQVRLLRTSDLLCTVPPWCSRHSRHTARHSIRCSPSRDRVR